MKKIHLIALVLCLLLTGCAISAKSEVNAEEGEKSSVTVESMDTIMSLTAYGVNREKALENAQKEIFRLNDLLSVGVESSEVSQVNRMGTLTLSEDTMKIVERSLELYTRTEGAFDITVYPLMELWGFISQNYHVPTAEELSVTLAQVGANRLTLDTTSNTLTLGEGQAIDLGGIAKGYTSQRIVEEFQAAGVTSGIVSLGGNVHCLGSKPDGTPYRVGIREPNNEGDIAAIVEVTNSAVITSGGYERFFVDEESGLTYQHILDPSTGIPAESDLLSVTIISEDGMLADCLSTALYIMGLDKASDFWRNYSDQFQAVFIDTDNRIYVTEGLKESVSSEGAISVIE